MDFSGSRWDADIALLEDEGWWNEDTQEVSLETLFYNIDNELFTAAKVTFVQMSAGGVSAKADILSLGHDSQENFHGDLVVWGLMVLYVSVHAFTRCRQVAMEAREAQTSFPKRMCLLLLCRPCRFVYFLCVCIATAAVSLACYLRYLVFTEKVAQKFWEALTRQMQSPPCPVELTVPARDVRSAVNCWTADGTFDGSFSILNRTNLTKFEIRTSMYLDSAHVPHVFALVQLWEYALLADCFAFFFIFASFIQVLGLYLPFRDIGDICLKAASGLLTMLLWYALMVLVLAFVGCYVFPADDQFSGWLQAVRTCMLAAVGDVRIEMPSDEVAGYYPTLLPVIFLTCLDVAHLYVLASLFLAFGSAVPQHDASKYAGSLDEYYTTCECCKLRFPETVENARNLKAELHKLEREIAAENENELENFES